MMYYPLIETDPNCVPYLSGSYIDSFCQDLVRRFDPDVIEKGHPLNIERFITDYLGLNLEVENLSCDLSILGATVFSDTDEFPVYDVRLNEAVYRSAKEGTVFVENELRRRGLSNRYRFTLAHEAGHAIWHGLYYKTLSRTQRNQIIHLSCTNKNTKLSHRDPAPGRLNSIQLMEYQANRSANSLLMPAEAVRRLKAGRGECLTRDEAEDRIIMTASVFRVSDAAARYRLEQLGLIEKPRRKIITAKELLARCAAL